MFNIKYNYIIFYITSDGINQGTFDWSSNKRIKTSTDILNIERRIEDKLNNNAIITNYKYVGWSWK